ncbi:hypothetical protein QR680_016516 [Steinernema hermaphroditum]|uniref:Uncharacterized protein n=1 Tax=Steinernema hermaphroditum TaxID=289476 RepID=A0AA39HBU1_9BILA|nr:hypothetical protein QR680_016516 [Steinernema hermaphroditum]
MSFCAELPSMVTESKKKIQMVMDFLGALMDAPLLNQDELQVAQKIFALVECFVEGAPEPTTILEEYNGMLSRCVAQLQEQNVALRGQYQDAESLLSFFSGQIDQLTQCKEDHLRKIEELEEDLDVLEGSLTKETCTLRILHEENKKLRKSELKLARKLKTARATVKNLEKQAFIEQKKTEEISRQLVHSQMRDDEWAEEASLKIYRLEEACKQLSEEKENLGHILYQIRLEEERQKQLEEEKTKKQMQCSEEDLFQMFLDDHKAESIRMVEDFKKYYGQPGALLGRFI